MLLVLILPLQVVFVSRDAFKLNFMKRVAPSSVTGWIMSASIFSPATAQDVKTQYTDIPDIYVDDCFADLGANFTFAKNLLTTGIVSKAINSSILIVDASMFEDSKYYAPASSLVNTVRKSYGDGTRIGVIDLFPIGLDDPGTAVSRDADVKRVAALLSGDAEYVITNDVNRVKRALKEEVMPSMGRSLQGCVSEVIFVSLLISSLTLC